VKVVVLGAGGQLAAAVMAQFARTTEMVALTRADLDITDRAQVRARIGSERPSVIVNCAAYNAVDAAEDNPVTALEVNALAVRSLAYAAADSGATLVHYGTDFVFDGRVDRPYSETDRPNPESAYAASKLLGEWFAATAPRYYVLRVESLFGSVRGGPAHGSADEIIRGIRAGAEVPVFVDRTVSPTYVVDAAAATSQVLGGRLPSGTYHCVNSGCTTWSLFAEEAARLLGVAPRLAPMTLEKAALRVKRPKYCALSNARLAEHGVTLPDWRDALRRSLST
jgi:dTDP-4-dehydrorhamnose reductase